MKLIKISLNLIILWNRQSQCIWSLIKRADSWSKHLICPRDTYLYKEGISELHFLIPATPADLFPRMLQGLLKWSNNSALFRFQNHAREIIYRFAAEVSGTKHHWVLKDHCWKNLKISVKNAYWHDLQLTKNMHREKNLLIIPDCTSKWEKNGQKA